MMTESEKIDREREGRDVFYFMSFFYIFFRFSILAFMKPMTFSSGLHNIPGARQRLIRLPYHIAISTIV